MPSSKSKGVPLDFRSPPYKLCTFAILDPRVKLKISSCQEEDAIGSLAGCVRALGRLRGSREEALGKCLFELLVFVLGSRAWINASMDLSDLAFGFNGS